MILQPFGPRCAAIGTIDPLYCVLSKPDYYNDKTIYRVVAIVEKFYDILEHIHSESLECGHVGYKKTLFYVY